MDAHQSEKNNVLPISEMDQSRENQIRFLTTSLTRLLKIKDSGTLAHSQRVHELIVEWTKYMQSRYQWMELDVGAIEMAGLLHDVGKIGILDEVLTKPDALYPNEREHLEQHAELGYQLVRDYPGMSDVAVAIRHHHERWDGTGYPMGLKGDRIPMSSQIIAMVDTYDAITSDRPYRKARTEQVAFEELKREAGRQFSTSLVESFIQFMHARNT